MISEGPGLKRKESAVDRVFPWLLGSLMVASVAIMIGRGLYLDYSDHAKQPKPQYYVGQLYTLEPEGTPVKVLSIYRYDIDAQNWRYLVRYKGQLIEAYERELRSTSAEAVSQRKRVEQ